MTNQFIDAAILRDFAKYGDKYGQLKNQFCLAFCR